MNIKNWIVNFICNIALISLCFSNVVFAVSIGTDVKNTLIEITQVLLIIAAGVCVAKVIHIGILYVSTVAMDKSSAKSAILPWLVGTFLCFGAAVIGPAIIEIFQSGLPSKVLEY